LAHSVSANTEGCQATDPWHETLSLNEFRATRRCRSHFHALCLGLRLRDDADEPNASLTGVYCLCDIEVAIRRVNRLAQLPVEKPSPPVGRRSAVLTLSNRPAAEENAARRRAALPFKGFDEATFPEPSNSYIGSGVAAWAIISSVVTGSIRKQTSLSHSPFG
jgi:hypothetical protein